LILVSGSRKSGSRSTRPNGESTESTLPPVADAAAWPTPQIAQGEEKKKAQEKTEKSEKSPVLRAHGKEKWTPVPYVPTAVFNTPLPSAARRGGRPSRGGREGGRGGAHGTSAHNGPDNKAAAASGQAAQVPATKQTALPDRGRNESIPARANSLPAQARRPTSVDTGAQTEQRRPSQTPDRSRGDIRAKAPEETHAPTNGPQATTGDAMKSHREPRYSGKNQESAPVHKGADHNSRSGNLPAADGHNGARFSSHERRFDAAPRSADLARESTNWREHRDFTRDRGEYQRDREHPRERGDSRPERGRGGYRGGRGGHSYAGGSQNPHFSNSQLSQNSYIPPKSFQRSQQQGFPNGTQPHNSAHRLSLRSPSLPSSAGLYGAYPLPDISTMYAYQPMHPGPMTAIPYQPYMEPFSLIGMIQMQL
jgi:la-related protein 1